MTAAPTALPRLPTLLSSWPPLPVPVGMLPRPMPLFSCFGAGGGRTTKAPSERMGLGGHFVGRIWGQAALSDRVGSSGSIQRISRARVSPVTLRAMRIVRGKVVGGQVVLEGEPLPEGSRVMVYAEDEEGGFHLDDSIRELLEAQSEIRRGNFVTAEDVLRELES